MISLDFHIYSAFRIEADVAYERISDFILTCGERIAQYNDIRINQPRLIIKLNNSG
jgi:hypothetical protein